jgi:16S rRNA G527 N7-methylase RsmG
MTQQDRQKLIETFLDYNSKINLSAIRDADGVYHKHILDSLELTTVLSLESGKTLADVGTG